MKVVIDTVQIQEGCEAFKRGTGIGSNPYQEGTSPALGWLVGYTSEYYFRKEGERYRQHLQTLGEPDKKVN